MEKTGTVYFFTGLSGAGKSTIGGLFFQRLRAQKPNVFLLDGDRYRREVCEDLGYTEEDRLKAARRGFRLSRWLADQGIDGFIVGEKMWWGLICPSRNPSGLTSWWRTTAWKRRMPL